MVLKNPRSFILNADRAPRLKAGRYALSSVTGIMIRKPPFITITVILLLALSLSVAVSAVRPSTISKTVPPKCPVISVSCPTADRPFTFTAAVHDADGREKSSNRYVEYCWTLSKGKILLGQGTDSITVDASSTDMRSLTATVEVRGFDSECQTKASCSTSPH